MRVGPELLLLVLIVAVTTWWIGASTPIRRIGLTLSAAIAAALLLPRLWSPPTPTLASQQAPTKTTDLGYVSSAKCRACHPGQFESWHRSYHRTMTQVASRESILAPYQDTVVEGRGRRFVLDVRDGELWARDLHPDKLVNFVIRNPGFAPPPSTPSVEGPIVMTTGSHHMQIYWVKDQLGVFRQLTWVWLREDRRWVPTEDVYSQPESGYLGIAGNWAYDCSPCHSTGPEPRLRNAVRSAADTRVGELGIACEACHGPAESHVAANGDPIRRYLHYLGADRDDTIVNPASLDHVRSAQVCGQCHSNMMNRSNEGIYERGSDFRPGMDLDAYRELRTLDTEPKTDSYFPAKSTVLYWPDGAARSAGREYNAMVGSRCYTQGELDCVSCHSMHESDPDDQLAANMKGDGACLQCHDGYAGAAGEAHTHHDADSTGSRCTNCHMANTTYGLLKMTRMHRIDVPVVAGVDGGERPNACNLCHLDQTLAWSQQHMEQWYGTPRRALTEDEETIPAGVLWLVRGNSVQRTTAAWHFGWPDALAALPDGWSAPWLVRSLDDPYASVRYLAGKSLSRMPGFEGFRHDYLEPAPMRSVTVQTAKFSAGWDPEAEAARQALFDRLRASRDDETILFLE